MTPKPRKIRTLGWKGPIPEGLRKYHELALKEGTFPDPSSILRDVPDKVLNAFREAWAAIAIRDPQAEFLRRAYLTILADAVMLENPLEKQKFGQNAAMRGR